MDSLGLVLGIVIHNWLVRRIRC